VDEADLVVFNTCSVRERAEQKLRSEAGKLAKLKRQRPDLVLCVAGCVAQQEGERLLRQIPHVDLVVGPDNIAELPALVLDQQAGAPPRAHTVFDLDRPRFLPASYGSPGGRRAPASAWVTTMKGCDERCSFCIVPTTRGPERYRPADEIIEEIRHVVGAGAREVTLLGQTVDSYRDPGLPPPVAGDPDETQFPHLLARIAGEVPELRRLRYTSPHPRHATPSLVRAHATLDVLARHVHLPVQSGSDRILRRMIRRYTRAEYIQRAHALQRARADLTLSTDVIVGFPGETDLDFEATLSLVREAGFVSLFGFKYSERPGTPASRLADDVPEEVKAERLASLFEVSEAQGKAHLERLVGATAAVLLEGPSKGGAAPAGMRIVSGRTERNEIVHVELPASVDAAGALVRVTITRAYKHSLLGEIAAADLPRLPVAAAARGRRALPLLGAP
jgi:tRNA-2-methylthio-N6-dimethylallyladenosine synthase